MTFDSLVSIRKKAEIEAIASAHCPGGTGSKSWLKFYQSVKREVRDSLTEEEIREYYLELESSRKQGIPKEIQQM